MNVMKNLCIVLTNKGKEKIKQERKLKLGSQTDASWSTGIAQINISRWERGVYNPKYYSFISYLNHLKLKKDFLRNKEYVSRTKYHGFKIKKIKSKKMSKKKAYILGVIGPGDGYTSGSYSIGLNAIDKDFVDYFQDCLENVFGLKCKRYIKLSKPNKLVKVESRQYLTVLCSKSAVESLKKYKVSFKEKVWKIPEIIKNGKNIYKARYLRGIFDSQSTIASTARFIGMKILNIEGLKEIKKLLKDIGIESSLYYKEPKIQISGKKYLELYQETVGFTIKRKKEKLKKTIEAYKQNQPPKRDVQKLIPEMIRLKKEGLSYRKIAKNIEVGKDAVRINLHKIGY